MQTACTPMWTSLWLLKRITYQTINLYRGDQTYMYNAFQDFAHKSSCNVRYCDHTTWHKPSSDNHVSFPLFCPNDHSGGKVIAVIFLLHIWFTIHTPT